MTHKEYRELLSNNRQQAQQIVFKKYINYVYTIVYNKLRSCAEKEDIDECVSDVFSIVFFSYNTELEIDGDIKGFIGKVAYRKAASYYKKLCKAPFTASINDENMSELPDSLNIEAATEKKETRHVILNLIESLGEPDSTIIIQSCFYERTAKEISEFVPLSPAMIRVRKNRALKKLKKLFSDNDITL